MLKIYHNTRCGKSRQTLKLIQNSGNDAEIVEYMKRTIGFDELKDLIKKLGITPEQLIRKGESIFKEKYKGQDLSDDEWITAMIEYPVLIERPIVVKGDRAIIGRPPENVNDLL